MTAPLRTLAAMKMRLVNGARRTQPRDLYDCAFVCDRYATHVDTTQVRRLLATCEQIRVPHREAWEEERSNDPVLGDPTLDQILDYAERSAERALRKDALVRKRKIQPQRDLASRLRHLAAAYPTGGLDVLVSADSPYVTLRWTTRRKHPTSPAKRVGVTEDASDVSRVLAEAGIHTQEEVHEVELTLESELRRARERSRSISR